MSERAKRLSRRNFLFAAGAGGVATAVTDRYRAETGREPSAFAVSAVDGAGVAPDN